VFLLLKLIKPLIALVVLAGAAYLFAPAVGTISAKTLHRGVVGELGGTRAVGPSACRRRSATAWHCDVWPQSGSGAVRYLVRMNGRRCWTARRTSGQGSDGVLLAARASSCLHLRDQLPTVPS
jgi:hypothetical protein